MYGCMQMCLYITHLEKYVWINIHKNYKPNIPDTYGYLSYPILSSHLISAFGAAIDAHRRAGNSVKALECLQDMYRNRVQPNAAHYNLVIRTLKAEGYVEKMFKMVIIHIAISVYIFICIPIGQLIISISDTYRKLIKMIHTDG